MADTNPAVQAAAVSALLHLGVSYEETAQTIRELTQQSDPGIRASAARALSRGRGREVVEVLRLLLDDPLPRPRIAAARALGQIGGVDTVGILKKALRDQDDAVKATAGGALGRVLSSR
jgi:HEAT repeat protein